MPPSNVNLRPPRPAGDFSRWLTGIQAAIAGRQGSDVPCDGCTACCTASQFIPIAPDETDTLAHVPRALLFPAPRRPRGHFVLGYDDRGHCPMLVDGHCSIYEHRPRACRTYDCRVYPAAGLRPDLAMQQGIADRVDEWQFGHEQPADGIRHAAVRAAAAYLCDHAEELPDGLPGTVRLAVLAVELHELFVDDAATTVVEPRPDAVRRALQRALDKDQAQVGVSPGGSSASKPFSVNDTSV